MHGSSTNPSCVTHQDLSTVNIRIPHAKINKLHQNDVTL